MQKEGDSFIFEILNFTEKQRLLLMRNKSQFIIKPQQ